MKSLIVALLIVSAAAADELFCTPGSLFQQSCNSCICSDDGKSAACTDMLCPEDHVQKYCEPGKQFQLDDLSTCICSKDGTTAACTLGLQVYDKSRYLTKNSQYCTPGSTFSPDNCNSCVCSQDGTDAVCTLKMCSVDEPKRVCEPLKSFKDYCNTCFCDADGLSYSCTRMACDKNIWNEDGSMKVVVQKSSEKQVCEPRKTFNDYCNTCVCSEDGTSAACTRMWCDKEIWNEDGTTKVQLKAEVKQVCEPRKSFNDYCNTCVCSEDGLSAVCTRMYCDKNIWNEDGTTKVQLKTEAKKVCEPLKSFKDYCNTCFCDADGLSYSCTRMACDKNIWNEDGSMKVMAARSSIKQVCEPLQSFKDYCNTCVCSKDGLSAVCTRMYCDKNIWNQDGTSKLMVKSARVCTPLSQFKEQCNTCVCSEDGLSKVCTMMSCDAFDSA